MGSAIIQRSEAMKPLTLAVFFLATIISCVRGEVLIVADEFPAMEVLSARLKSEENIASKIIKQTELPGALESFSAVVVYIHGALTERAENAFIRYAENGGKLVLLHHSISSGKRRNAHWFSFLGVSLPEGDLANGGYKWIEGVSFSLVDLNPQHFVMTNKMSWPEKTDYGSNSSKGTPLPAFTLHETEVYVNHVHTEPRMLLMGLKYDEKATGKTYMQDTAGWVKPAGKGWVIYLMPGHAKHDFETPTYGRVVLNAIVWPAGAANKPGQ